MFCTLIVRGSAEELRPQAARPRLPAFAEAKLLASRRQAGHKKPAPHLMRGA